MPTADSQPVGLLADFCAHTTDGPVDEPLLSRGGCRFYAADDRFPYAFESVEYGDIAGIAVPRRGESDWRRHVDLGRGPLRADELAQRLEGIILWDAGIGRLSAIRGMFGTLPLFFYAEPRRRLVVSTDPDWLCEHVSLPLEPNCERLRQFLIQSADVERDEFIDGLTRVRPGERLRWEAATGPDIAPVGAYRPPDDTSEGPRDAEIRRHLARSLAARTDDTSVLALSGGFDSAALAGLACQHSNTSATRPVSTASMIAPHLEQLDESRRLDLLCRRLPITNRRLDVGPFWPLRDLDYYQAHPATGPQWHYGEHRGVHFYRWARGDRPRATLITGIGLEAILSLNRPAFIRECLASGTWSPLVRMVARGAMPPRQLLRRIVAELSPRSPQLSAMADNLRSLRRGTSQRRPWLDADRWVTDPPTAEPRDASASSAGYRPRALTSWRWELVTRGLYRRSVQSRTRLAFPYLDRRIWNYALRLPADCLMVDGDPKGLFVRAVSSLVPAADVIRQSSGYFDQLVQMSLAGYRRPFVESLFQSPYLADLGLIEPAAFREAFDAYCRAIWRHGNQRGVGSFPIWSTIAAEIWLRTLDGSVPER